MKSAIELVEAHRAGKNTVLETVTAAVRACDEGAPLNALTYLARTEALEQARSLDAIPLDRRSGKLFGVPVVVKDAICTVGLPTTAGSRMLQRETEDGRVPYRPPYDATVVERLKAAGAIVLGKANMDEFAMGSSNETSAYGPVLNPVDRERTPGGSSGGSAAAVAGGLAPVALGSDTGGSIRQPAALCGVVGVKPTFGRVSRYGLIAFASSLDQIGPMTPDVRSSARVLEVLAGADGRDSTVNPTPVGAYEAACDGGLSGLRFGLPAEYFQEGLDPKVRAVVDEAIERIRASGASVVPVELPHTRYGVATYYVLATAEASSNLARFDGVRYGLRVEDRGTNLTSLYSKSRRQGFGSEVRRRILLGTYVLSAGYYDAYYGKAQKVRTLIARDFDEAFAHVDVLLTPTSPTPAFRLGEKSNDPLAMYMADVFTLPASLAGVPALSLPIGSVAGPQGPLPVGLQLICPLYAEETLFRAASAIEGMMRS